MPSLVSGILPGQCSQALQLKENLQLKLLQAPPAASPLIEMLMRPWWLRAAAPVEPRRRGWVPDPTGEEPVTAQLSSGAGWPALRLSWGLPGREDSAPG